MPFLKSSSSAASKGKASIFSKPMSKTSKNEVPSKKMFGKSRNKMGGLFSKKGPNGKMGRSTDGDESMSEAKGLSPDMGDLDDMMESAMPKKKKKIGNMTMNNKMSMRDSDFA